MAKDDNDLIKALPAARRRKIEKRAVALIAEEMTLQELRRARSTTQVRMRKIWGMPQNKASEMERRTDLHISTLRRSIEALGGKLSLAAEFPDRDPVVIVGIGSLDGIRRPSYPPTTLAEPGGRGLGRESCSENATILSLRQNNACD